MMWRKAWWECRFRVVLVALIIILYPPAALFPLLDSVGPAMALSWYLRFVLVCGSIVAVMMAGSGVNAQSSWGTSQGFHPSMYFLLSLPVSRRYALFVRAFLGMVISLLFVALSLAVFALLGPLRGVHLNMAQVFSSTVFISLGVLSFFGLTTLLTTVLDELMAGIMGMGFVGGAFGAMAALHWKGAAFQLMPFFTGQTFQQTGRVVWPAVLFFGAITAASLLAAAYVVERKEY